MTARCTCGAGNGPQPIAKHDYSCEVTGQRLADRAHRAIVLAILWFAFTLGYLVGQIA